MQEWSSVLTVFVLTVSYNRVSGFEHTQLFPTGSAASIRSIHLPTKLAAHWKIDACTHLPQPLLIYIFTSIFLNTVWLNGCPCGVAHTSNLAA